MVDSHLSISEDVIQVVNNIGKQDVKPDGIQFRNIHHKSILLNLLTDNDLYDNESYAFDTDWKIGKEPETNLKKIKFNIDVNNNEIDHLNDEDTVHLKHGLADDNNTDIKDCGVQHKQDYQRNCFGTPVENKQQPSHQLEGQNQANDWKSTNKHEGKLVMAYNKHSSNKTLHPTPLYGLNIGLNGSNTDHSVFKLSTKQLLTTPKYKPVHMLEDIIQALNEMGTITNNIQLNHFDCDQHTVQQNHFCTT